MMKKSLDIPIIGLPNVGKSTLLNALFGEKISIVTNKPHTTRTIDAFHKKFEDVVLDIVDTPGIKKTNSKLGKVIFRNMQSYLKSLDRMILVLDCNNLMLDIFSDFINKSIVVVNKIDNLRKPKLLPILNQISLLNPIKVFCVCARTGDGVEDLLGYLKGEISYEEASDFEIMESAFDSEVILSYATECVREKMLLTFDQEIPYNVVIKVREAGVFKESAWRIFLDIIVPKESYKPIIIGKKGENLKNIGEMVRLELACKIKQPGFLGLNVVVDNNLWKRKDTYLNLGWKV